MLVHNYRIYWPIIRRPPEELFLTGLPAVASAKAGSRGGGFPFRFNFSPKARCALRLGVGPRAFGFSMLLGAETIKYSSV